MVGPPPRTERICDRGQPRPPGATDPEDIKHIIVLTMSAWCMEREMHLDVQPIPDLMPAFAPDGVVLANNRGGHHPPRTNAPLHRAAVPWQRVELRIRLEPRSTHCAVSAGAVDPRPDAQQRRRHRGRDRVLANPAGYNPAENPDYDPALCIVL